MGDDGSSGPAADASVLARELKQALVRHPERADDLYPTLVAYREGQLVAVCDLRGSWADRNDVLRDAVAVLAPDEVALVTEASASAALEVLQMTSSGEGTQVLLPYRYVDGDVVWSDTPKVGSPGEPTGTTGLEGDIAGSLRAGFAAAGEPHELEEARAALEALGVRVRFAADADPFLGVEPDDPCPCGSNRTLKDCHGYL